MVKSTWVKVGFVRVFGKSGFGSGLRGKLRVLEGFESGLRGKLEFFKG